MALRDVLKSGNASVLATSSTKSLVQGKSNGATSDNLFKTENQHGPVYIVEKVLRHKWRNGEKYAHIKWKGFSKSQSTWEPAESIFIVESEQKREVQKAVGKRKREKTKECKIHIPDLRGLNDSAKTLIELESPGLVQESESKNKRSSSADVADACVSQIESSGIVTKLQYDSPLFYETLRKAETSSEDPVLASSKGWSAKKVRDFFSAHGFPNEAAILYEEHVDGAAVLSADHSDLARRGGVRRSQLFKFSRIVCRMQDGILDF